MTQPKQTRQFKQRTTRIGKKGETARRHIRSHFDEDDKLVVLHATKGWRTRKILTEQEA